MPQSDKTPLTVRKSHFRNLASIAAADGQWHPAEADFLSALGERWGLSFMEIQEVLARPDLVEFVAPDDAPTRIHQLVELVSMMMIDGEVDDAERRLCLRFGKRLGFSDSLVAATVDTIIDGITEKRPPREIARAIARKL